jgi:hypothetical protein
MTGRWRGEHHLCMEVQESLPSCPGDPVHSMANKDEMDSSPGRALCDRPFFSLS